MSMLYHSLIQSKLDYCLSLWGSCANKYMATLQRAQCRAAHILGGNQQRLIAGELNPAYVSGLQLVRNFGWLDMEKRFYYFINVLTFKCIHGLAPEYMTKLIANACDEHAYNTRFANSRGLLVPHFNTAYFKNSFQCNASILWNKLPQEIRNATSLKLFKRQVKAFYLNTSCS